MKIGMVNNSHMLTSLQYLFDGIEQVLGERHETVYRPPQYLHSPKSRREEMTKDLILNCDVALGWMDDTLLETRERVGKHLPYVWFPLGGMTRGFAELKTNARHLKTTDLIVCHCSAEVEIVRRFTSNAQVRLLPFVFDESTFYPLDEAARQQAKSELGFAPEDKVLLYAGRITAEKNLHTVLKIFAALQEMVPDLHLVVVGQEAETPFMEFGVFPVSMKGTFYKLTGKLGLDQRRLHFFGGKGAAELRALYNVADVLINLTLHHDENFGLGQVEAMACGTPVVGTNWGGLKDTIVHGETGYKVSTVATSALGVKVNWWEVVCRVVSLLEDKDEAARLGRRGAEHVRENYSFAPFSRVVNSIISDCEALGQRDGEPLETTEFAAEFWRECPPLRGSLPFYRYSPRAYQLYREVISPYAGALPGGEAEGVVAPDDLLCLASPTSANGDGSLSVDDFIFPFVITLPEAHAGTIGAALEALKSEPVIKAERLSDTYLAGSEDIPGALEWMLDSGLLLKTHPDCGRGAPANVGGWMSAPLFSFRRIDATVDAVTLG
ncbi:MAG TPA: glycosyltransferase family 4 protein [Pyrinomonadaceae bacterium]|jgi:glycosyltransferase involved in cell wall biosynthesis